MFFASSQSNRSLQFTTEFGPKNEFTCKLWSLYMTVTDTWLHCHQHLISFTFLACQCQATVEDSWACHSQRGGWQTVSGGPLDDPCILPLPVHSKGGRKTKQETSKVWAPTIHTGHQWSSSWGEASSIRRSCSVWTLVFFVSDSVRLSLNHLHVWLSQNMDTVLSEYSRNHELTLSKLLLDISYRNNRLRERSFTKLDVMPENPLWREQTVTNPSGYQKFPFGEWDCASSYCGVDIPRLETLPTDYKSFVPLQSEDKIN